MIYLNEQIGLESDKWQWHLQMFVYSCSLLKYCCFSEWKHVSLHLAPEILSKITYLTQTLIHIRKNQLYNLVVTSQGHSDLNLYSTLHHALLYLQYMGHITKKFCPWQTCMIMRKNQIFDLVLKGQGHNDQILMCDTLPCSSTYTYNIWRHWV